MITLSTMCESFTVHSEAIEIITSCRSSEEANRTILDYIIYILKGDQEMMDFCNLMQKLISNPRLSKITSALRTGVECMLKYYVIVPWSVLWYVYINFCIGTMFVLAKLFNESL